MKRIDGGYKLSELLSGRGGGATVEFRFWAVVLTKKWVFDKACEKIGVAGFHFSTHGYAVSLFAAVDTECKAIKC